MAFAKAERRLATWGSVAIGIWTVGFAAGYNEALFLTLFIAVISGARYGADKGKAFES